MRIIFNHDDYIISLIIAGIDNLQTHREHLTEQFFLHNVLNEKSSLHYLLPNKRDVNIVNRLRLAKTFELSQTRSERFKNRSSHTVLHTSNSIYGRYTLFN